MIPQYDIPQNNFLQSILQQSSMPQNDISQSIMSQKNLPRRIMPHNVIPRNSLPQYNVPQYKMSQCNVSQNNVPQNSNVLRQKVKELKPPPRLCMFKKFSSLLNSNAIASRIAAKLPGEGAVYGKVVYNITKAVESKMIHLLRQLSIAAEHRLENSKLNPFYVEAGNCKKQIHFLEEIDKKQHENMLLRQRQSLLKARKYKPAADPDHVKAREIIQNEKSFSLFNSTNATAMAALTTTKTRKRSWGSDNPFDRNQESGYRTVATHRPRKKRITMKDLRFLFETDSALKRSHLRHNIVMTSQDAGIQQLL
uniref:TAF4 domain-containing protein n=1 Tax=Rhabditophanes sp. KR3021 TaxID=114890 RepID=A0AC35UEL4_9BILA